MQMIEKSGQQRRRHLAHIRDLPIPEIALKRRDVPLICQQRIA